MRISFIILILFISTERSIANPLANACPGIIGAVKKVNYDTLPKQDIAQLYSCSPFEQPAEINLKQWMSYLENVLVLEGVLLDSIPEGCYQVVVQFVIDKEGKLIDVKTQKDPGYGWGRRAVSLISQYPGRWQPAKRNGRPVKSFQRQTISFLVETDKEESNGCKELLPSAPIL